MPDPNEPAHPSTNLNEPMVEEADPGTEPLAVKKMTHDVDTDDMFVQGGE